MRREISNAAQFYTALATGQLDHESIKIYAKPLGAICHFYRDSAGNGHLISGSVTHDVNDPISQHLLACDVDDGLVVVGLADHDIRHGGNFARWLNYAITFEQDDPDWINRLMIYTTADSIQHREPAILRRLVQLDENPEHLREAQVRLSINRDFDGLIITATHHTQGDKIYYMVPSRSVMATIAGVVDQDGRTGGLVIRANHDHRCDVLAVQRIPEAIKAMSYQEARSLIGREVVLEYTTCLDGDYINNFSAAAVLDI